METPKESDSGYPEEQPDDVAQEGGDDTPQRGPAGEDEGGGPPDRESDPDTATGNPRSAG
jgi:hypothetical protein